MLNYVATSSVSSISSGIGLFAVIVGILGAVGGALGLFAKGRAEAIIKAQAELIDTRDRQLSDAKQSIAALTSANTVLTEQNATLTSLAQGSPQLVKMTTQIKNLVTQVAKLTKAKAKK